MPSGLAITAHRMLPATARRQSGLDRSAHDVTTAKEYLRTTAPSRDERSRRRRDVPVGSRKYPGRLPVQGHGGRERHSTNGRCENRFMASISVPREPCELARCCPSPPGTTCEATPQCRACERPIRRGEAKGVARKRAGNRRRPSLSYDFFFAAACLAITLSLILS
jgi:hypothetical protein